MPDDQTFCYSAFDRPLGNTLAAIRAKELNLLLHAIARVRDISIVDVDAIAADLGQLDHFAHPVHADRVFEAAVREQIIHILRERGVAGCLRNSRPSGGGTCELTPRRFIAPPGRQLL